MGVQLGDKVKDRVTGFVGIALCRTEWLNGCVRICVQPIGLNKEGKTFASETFDEPQLTVIKPAAVVCVRRKPMRAPDHGPRDDAAAQKR